MRVLRRRGVYVVLLANYPLDTVDDVPMGNMKQLPNGASMATYSEFRTEAEREAYVRGAMDVGPNCYAAGHVAGYTFYKQTMAKNVLAFGVVVGWLAGWYCYLCGVVVTMLKHICSECAEGLGPTPCDCWEYGYRQGKKDTVRDWRAREHGAVIFGALLAIVIMWVIVLVIRIFQLW